MATWNNEENYILCDDCERSIKHGDKYYWVRGEHKILCQNCYKKRG